MMQRFACLFVSLLFVLALPAKSDPPNLGAAIATMAVSEGVLTLHERGLVLTYPDDSQLVSSFASVDDPMVLTASWQTQTSSGPITITVTYTLPVANPTEHQMNIYAERHMRMVTAQRLVFPPIPATN